MRLLNKVAIVTGGGRGIGKGIALGLAREGAIAVVVDINQPNAEDTAKEIMAMGRSALALKADVSVSAEVQVMVKATMAQFGRIDILVNDAGTRIVATLLDATEESWGKVMAVNLKGVFLCTQAVAREMVKSGGGSIINISSFLAERGSVNRISYVASKGGVRSFTMAAALELARYNIRVNNLGPGTTDTPLVREAFGDEAKLAELAKSVPLGRIGRPEDLANAAIFLASGESSWVTGTSLYVDGGYLART